VYVLFTAETRRYGAQGICFRWRVEPLPNKTNLCENCCNPLCAACRRAHGDWA